MFSLSNWIKVSWKKKKNDKHNEAPYLPADVTSIAKQPVGLVTLGASRTLQREPAIKKEIQALTQEDEAAIAELLYQDLNKQLHNYREQVAILRGDLDSLRKEMANLVTTNVQLNADNIRLQDIVKGVTGRTVQLDHTPSTLF